MAQSSRVLNKVILDVIDNQICEGNPPLRTYPNCRSRLTGSARVAGTRRIKTSSDRPRHERTSLAGCVGEPLKL